MASRRSSCLKIPPAVQKQRCTGGELACWRGNKPDGETNTKARPLLHAEMPFPAGNPLHLANHGSCGLSLQL